jgi:uncharacterized membrane protein YphA (DoxX/SURF4 family)
MSETKPRPDGWWFLPFARVVFGYMWFQQTLWKLPPDWGGPGGLRHWIEEAGTYATPWYRSFVNGVVLPNFSFFAPQIWLGETIIAITLILGVGARLGGLLAAIMSLNLYFANSKIPHEWYWAYLFMALLGGVFFATRAGRYWGVDQLLVPRVEALKEKKPRLGRILLFLM